MYIRLLTRQLALGTEKQGLIISGVLGILLRELKWSSGYLSLQLMRYLEGLFGSMRMVDCKELRGNLVLVLDRDTLLVSGCMQQSYLARERICIWIASDCLSFAVGDALKKEICKRVCLRSDCVEE